jgi:hypothetical protein
LRVSSNMESPRRSRTCRLVLHGIPKLQGPDRKLPKSRRGRQKSDHHGANCAGLRPGSVRRLSRYHLFGKWRCSPGSGVWPGSMLVPAILAPVLGPNFPLVLAAGLIAAGIVVIITWAAVPFPPRSRTAGSTQRLKSSNTHETYSRSHPRKWTCHYP